MIRGASFRLVIASQFLGALADSALLIVAIQFLLERAAPAWNVPVLRTTFYASYVVMAAFAGAAADAWSKRRVLLVTNIVKLAGCGLLLAGTDPLLAYTLVGLGAVAHSPARYGILLELVPADALVAANAWMEAATVTAMLLGVVLASVLVEPALALRIAAQGVAWNAALVLAAIYLAATLCCVPLRSQPAANPAALRAPGRLAQTFAAATRRLWADVDARTSLAVTSVFWAAAAVLQFLILRWAAEQLHLALAQAALLQGAVALGTIAGATGAGRWVPARDALRVLPVGALIGATVLLVAFATHAGVALALLFAIGAMAGLLLVPMNALLQQRGAALMHPGQAVAVQHFSENAASLVLLAVYGLLALLEVPARTVVIGLGALVAVAMLLLLSRRRQAMRVLVRGAR